jgi:hypothetical protein
VREVAPPKRLVPTFLADVDSCFASNVLHECHIAYRIIQTLLNSDLDQFVMSENWEDIVRQARLARVNETSRCSGRGSVDFGPVFLVAAANPVE